MRSRTVLLLAALSAGALAFGRGAPAEGAKPAQDVEGAAALPKVDLSFEKFTLENGLEVILHVDRRTPIVAVNVWYHVGSKDEPLGKNGFAHLFEHVMFQGSKNVGEDMFFNYLEQAGASDRNGTTNVDRTNYFETVPSNQLELALWLESDRMGSLLSHANAETFKNQREVVKNERRQNYENAPYGLVRQFVRAAVYPEGHPYHRLTIGTPEDLDRASVEDVERFFRLYYAPNNATLSIAGDIDKNRTRALVEKYFGPIAKGATPPIKTAPRPVELAGETVLRVDANVELPRLIVSWPTPPHFAPGDAELDVVAQVLSTGKSSRLYKRLVYELQTAQSVSAFQESAQLSSTFEIVVGLKRGQSPEAALKVIDEELGRLRKTPPSADEVSRAKVGLVSSLIYRLERVTARADALNAYNQYTGDPGYLDEDIERYQAVTPEIARRSAEALLPEGKRVVTIVTPNPEAPRAGRLASVGVAPPAGGFGKPAGKGAPGADPNAPKAPKNAPEAPTSAPPAPKKGG